MNPTRIFILAIAIGVVITAYIIWKLQKFRGTDTYQKSQGGFIKLLKWEEQMVLKFQTKYRTVVLHTGSNALYSASTLNEIIAQMSNLGVRKIYMLNVRVPMGWEGLVNDHIAEVAQNWPELVVLVDWHEISGGHSEWFLDDGVHLTKDGAQAYVDITLENIRRDGCAP